MRSLRSLTPVVPLLALGVSATAHADDMGLSSLGPPLMQTLIGWFCLLLALGLALLFRKSFARRTWWKAFALVTVLAECKAFGVDWLAQQRAQHLSTGHEHELVLDAVYFPVFLPGNVGTFLCDPLALWPSVCTPSTYEALGRKSPWAILMSGSTTTVETCVLVGDPRLEELKKAGWIVEGTQRDPETTCLYRRVPKPQQP